MTNDEKKQYLKRYLFAKRNVALISAQIDELRSAQTNPVGLGDGMPKGNKKTDLSGYMAKLDTLLRELEAEKEIQMITFQEIRKSIENMKNNMEKEILTRRYILGQNWEKIAVEMGYSYRHTTKMHGQALKNFEI